MDVIPCAACLPPTHADFRPLHTDVPSFTQYQSADLIGEIVYGGRDRGDDPKWRQSGAPDQETYRRWCGHACGMTCLQMILAHRDGVTPPLIPLMLACADYGGYVTDPGTGDIRGLIYEPFTRYASETHALDARVRTDLDPTALREELDAGRLVMASVHREVRRPELPPPGRGGHLVLVVGHDDDAVHVRNPSGHTDGSRRARLPWKVFDSFAARRGVSIAPGAHERGVRTH